MQILEAAGIDWQSDTSGKWFGSAQRGNVERWAKLGLTHDEIIEVLAEVVARKRDGPPGSLRYFDRAMERRAGEKAAPELTPDAAGGRGRRGGDVRERAADAAIAARKKTGGDVW